LEFLNCPRGSFFVRNKKKNTLGVYLSHPWCVIKVNTNNKPKSEKERKELIQEATELMNIFGSILKKL